jgi:uncharacterized protein (TIGR03435 family)
MRAPQAVIAFVVASACSDAVVSAQSPTFDVVSIKRNEASQAGRFENSTTIQRPDGGLVWTHVSTMTLIGRAYPVGVPADFAGIPDWARREYFDVSATSSLSTATPEDRIAMLRAMLADRFKLVVHIEKRETPVYDLVLARSDGRLGSGMTPSDRDCAPILAKLRADAEAARNATTPPNAGPPAFPDLNAPPPLCSLRGVGARPPAVGDRLEGESTVENLALALRFPTGRLVIDKTGLSGTYRITMTFDRIMSLKGPEIVASPDSPPTVFTAVREQLGLKLESSKAELDTLIIDRLERPTEN